MSLGNGKADEIPRLTDICRIGLYKKNGTERAVFRRSFTAGRDIRSAVFRIDSDGVCGITLNGQFVEACKGHLPDRVCAFRVERYLVPGENVLTLSLQSRYFQGCGEEIAARRGAYFMTAAAELIVEDENGETRIVTEGADGPGDAERVPADGWTCEADGQAQDILVFSQVTRAEYAQFWKTAAVWDTNGMKEIPEEVRALAGPGYDAYIAEMTKETAGPAGIVRTNLFRREDGTLQARICDINFLYVFTEDDYPYVIYDFGRMVVGYTEIGYTAKDDLPIELMFDYSESPDDFLPDSRYHFFAKRLMVKDTLTAGEGLLRIERRRAFRYLKIRIPSQYAEAVIRKVSVRVSMMPAPVLGYFHCEDGELNGIWKTGAYTLLVNRDQEYQSCPRHEMKHFTGDGVIDALADYYVTGDPQMCEASLAVRELRGDNGLVSDIYERNLSLWDYPSWRVIMVYNHYRQFGDPAFVKKHYADLVLNMEWSVERMNREDLIFQFPVYEAPFFADSGAVEWSCSFDRLGEKPLANAVFARALADMAEMGALMEDPRSAEWAALSERVKAAVNRRLWDDREGVYRDPFDRDYVPEDANALCVLLGIADEEKADRALTGLQKNNWTPYGSVILSEERNHTRGGRRTVSPAMNSHEAAALFARGRDEEAIELLRRCFGSMIRKGAGTFWEYAPNAEGERWPAPAHAWSAGCCYAIGAGIAGLRPDTPGWKSAVFKPSKAAGPFEAVVPTPKGLAAVRAERKDGALFYTVACPASLRLRTELPEGTACEIRQYG